MRKLILSLTLLTLPLAGCFDSNSDSTDGAAMNLIGSWTITGVDGKAVTANAERPLTITFEEDGKFHGQNFCNNFFGTAEMELPKISFGASGATMMACPDLDKEQALFTTLGKIDNVASTDGGYELRVGDQPGLTLAPAAK